MSVKLKTDMIVCTPIIHIVKCSKISFKSLLNTNMFHRNLIVEGYMESILKETRVSLKDVPVRYSMSDFI